MNDQGLPDLEGIPEEYLTPDELAALAEQREMELRAKLLDGLSADANRMVSEAVQARNASGVERRWEEDLSNFYGSDLGVAPKTVVDRASDVKTRTEGELASRSQIGVNITRPKANAAAARLIEMATPTDERNFMLKPSPNPRLAAAARSSIRLSQGGQPLTKADGSPMTGGDLARLEAAEAERRASRMQAEVDDALSECDFTGELRASIMDMVKLGTGIMAGPLPRRVIDRSWQQAEEQDPETGESRRAWRLVMEERYVPWSERVNPADFFPDPACRGDMRAARYAVWRKFYNSRTLHELKGQPGALDERIDECLAEGPRILTQSRDPHTLRYIDGDYFFDDKLLYESYLVFALFEPEQLRAVGIEMDELPGARNGLVPGMVLLVNGKAVKASLNPLDSGDLPFDMMHYEKIDNQPWGVGVPFVVRNPQRTVRAAWRMVMENAAQNIGPQIVVNKDLIYPANDSWEMTGRKVWYYQSQKGKANGTPMRMDEVFGMFTPESRIDQLLKIIEFALKFAEDETSLPALLEGRQGRAPDTVGGMQLLDNRANEVLMRLVRQNDDELIKPHVTRHVDWQMQYSADDEIKGDLQVTPMSATAMREKTIEAEALSQIGQYVLHPMLGKFHKRGGYDWLRRVYKLVRLDPDAILEDSERVDSILKAESERPPVDDPRIAVAKINAETKLQEAQVKQGLGELQAELTKNVELLRFQATMTALAEKLAAEKQITLDQAKLRMTELLTQFSHEDRLFQAEAALKLSPNNPTKQGI